MDKVKRPTYGNGKLCYLEIPTADIDQSVKFYSTVFGWNIRRRSNGSIAFDDTAGEVSGSWIPGRKPARDPSMLLYIMVDSAASTLDVIVASGGRVVQPIGMDPPEITARFRDPSGNVFGLYQQPK